MSHFFAAIFLGLIGLVTPTSLVFLVVVGLAYFLAPKKFRKFTLLTLSLASALLWTTLHFSLNADKLPLAGSSNGSFLTGIPMRILEHPTPDRAIYEFDPLTFGWWGGLYVNFVFWIGLAATVIYFVGKKKNLDLIPAWYALVPAISIFVFSIGSIAMMFD